MTFISVISQQELFSVLARVTGVDLLVYCDFVVAGISKLTLNILIFQNTWTYSPKIQGTQMETQLMKETDIREIEVMAGILYSMDHVLEHFESVSAENCTPFWYIRTETRENILSVGYVSF
jgi:hypothetical protein